MGLLFADFVHNLRSALDHLAFDQHSQPDRSIGAPHLVALDLRHGRHEKFEADHLTEPAGHG
jgi:hypothetical protein